LTKGPATHPRGDFVVRPMPRMVMSFPGEVVESRCMVKKVCCVCRKELGDVPGPPERLTHGFCEACYRSELRAWEARLGAPGPGKQPPHPAGAKPASG
jgi:hypothetical protein